MRESRNRSGPLSRFWIFQPQSMMMMTAADTAGCSASPAPRGLLHGDIDSRPICRLWWFCPPGVAAPRVNSNLVPSTFRSKTHLHTQQWQRKQQQQPSIDEANAFSASRLVSSERSGKTTAREMSRRCSYAGMQQQSAPLTSAAPTSANDSSKKIHLFESLRNTMYQRSLEVPSQRQPSRRTSRSNDNAVTSDMDCSQQSILNAMDRFVKAVNNMDSTVLVPSRLKDMDVGGRVSPPPNLQVEDLHTFFTVLNDVKNELLWGPDLGNGLQILTSSTFNSGLRVPSVTTHSSHKRQPSNGSLGSTASDLETDNDSVSDYTDAPEQSVQLATAFRVHLQGLHTILHQLADSADYLAARYQEEVESSQ